MAGDGQQRDSPLISSYDALYRTQVLRLQDDQCEDDLENGLQDEAKELGLQWTVHARAHAQRMAYSIDTTSSFEDGTRRSESTDSRASRSTGLTSHVSARSRDRSSIHSSNHALKDRSRASWAFVERAPAFAQRSPAVRHSISSPLQALRHTQSVGPNPASTSDNGSNKRHFRRIRGLSLLKLHKHQSASPVATVDGRDDHLTDAVSHRYNEHKATYGHTPCLQAPHNDVPYHLHKSVSDAALSRSRPSVVPVAVSQSRPSSLNSRVDSLSPSSAKELDVLLASPSFKSMRARQLGERQRFYRWADESEADIQLRHRSSLQTLQNRQRQAVINLLEQHASALAVAEDRQVKAEADMRTRHVQEKRDNAVALKHMEFYCAGSYSTGEPHNRRITEQDRTELLKTRRVRDTMDYRHANAINILRGEQARRISLRVQRDGKATREMEQRHEMEESDLETRIDEERELLNDLCLNKKRRLIARWDLEANLVLGHLERDTGIVFTGTLPAVEWRSEDDMKMMSR